MQKQIRVINVCIVGDGAFDVPQTDTRLCRAERRWQKHGVNAVVSPKVTIGAHESKEKYGRKILFIQKPIRQDEPTLTKNRVCAVGRDVEGSDGSARSEEAT